MLKVTRNGRNGSLTRVIVTGTELELAQFIEDGMRCGRLGSVENGEIRGSASRSDVERMEKYAERSNVITAGNSIPQGAEKTRRIELLEAAQRQHLNHGASWVCTGWQVDRDSLDPSWEGRLVCYVYESAK